MTSSNETPIPGKRLDDSVMREHTQLLIDSFCSLANPSATGAPMHAHFSLIEYYALGDIAKLSWPTSDVFLYFEFGRTLSSTTPEDIIAYLLNREPWEEYDTYIYDKSMKWCVVITHDDVLGIVDPERCLAAAGVLRRIKHGQQAAD